MQDDERIIYLPRGLEVRVSYVDYLRFREFKWHFNSEKSPYACRRKKINGKSVKIYLHRAIMNAPKGLIVNHRDGDTLNCTRRNLHLVRHRSNVTKYRVKQGKCPFHGVHFRKRELGEVLGMRNVQAKITVGADRVFLGSFERMEDAARAYDRAAVEAFGLMADTNFPLTDYISPVNTPLPLPPEMDYIPF